MKRPLHAFLLVEALILLQAALAFAVFGALAGDVKQVINKIESARLALANNNNSSAKQNINDANGLLDALKGNPEVAKLEGALSKTVPQNGGTTAPKAGGQQSGSTVTQSESLLNQASNAIDHNNSQQADNALQKAKSLITRLL